MPTAHRPAARPATWRRRVVVSLALVTTLTGCSSPEPADRAGVGSARLEIDGRPIDLDVLACGLIDGRFPDAAPTTGSEPTLFAAGVTDADGQVTVRVRRSRDEVAPHLVHTVEITLGDPEVAVEALILYRGLDEDVGRWTEIDPDASDPRVQVPGPLLDLDDTSLRAEGTAWLPTDGRRVLVRLDARCPVQIDATPGIA